MDTLAFKGCSCNTVIACARRANAYEVHPAAAGTCYRRSPGEPHWRRQFQRPSTPTRGCCCWPAAGKQEVPDTLAALAVLPHSNQGVRGLPVGIKDRCVSVWPQPCSQLAAHLLRSHLLRVLAILRRHSLHCLWCLNNRCHWCFSGLVACNEQVGWACMASSGEFGNQVCSSHQSHQLAQTPGIASTPPFEAGVGHH